MSQILSISNVNTDRAKALMEVTFSFWHTHDFEMCPTFHSTSNRKALGQQGENMHSLSWEILGLPNEVMEQINTAGLRTVHQPPQKNQRCPRQNSCQTKVRISRVGIIDRQSERFRAGKALQGHAAQCAKLQFPTTIQKLDELPETICTHFIGENFNTNICQEQGTLSQDLVNVFSLYTKLCFGY